MLAMMSIRVSLESSRFWGALERENKETIG